MMDWTDFVGLGLLALWILLLKKASESLEKEKKVKEKIDKKVK